MKKILTITFDVEVNDLSKADLKENADLVGCKPSELVTLRDCAPSDIADSLVGAMLYNEENFAGSGMYIKILNTNVVNAEWRGK